MRRGGRGTGRCCKLISHGDSSGKRLCLHLGIKDAGSSLDNADSLIIGLDLIDIARQTRDDCDQVQTKILGMEIGGERVRKALLPASRDLDIVAGTGDIADNGSAGMNPRRQWLQRGQRAPDHSYLDGFRLIVRELQEGLCRVPIDQLDTKHLCVRERSSGRNGEVRCYRSLELFFDLGTR
jgi:hypothetical protein